LILGLGSAGKTSILYKLKLGEVITTIPTNGFNCEKVTYSGYSIDFWDLGGEESVRPTWSYYTTNNDALIYVVDCNDRNTMSNAVSELKKFLDENSIFFTSSTPIAILGNKQDIYNSVGVYELEHTFSSVNGNKKFFPTSCVSGDGLYEFIAWLIEKWNGF